VNIAKYYQHIYRLSFITRYSNLIRIRDEDVAQHSFFVAAIVLKLHEKYDFDLGLALQAAISHDITEGDITDVTHGIKRRHPDVAKSIRNAEDIEIRKYPQAVRTGVNVFESKCVEGLIANLADVLQVRQYVNTEVALGNTSMSYILTETARRINKLEEELYYYERSYKKDIETEEKRIRRL
jgi:5'-deoxynucleotidase YfbR-like HD superfamily hydrolase